MRRARFIVSVCVACMAMGASGCFSGVRPIGQMEAGRWMVGGGIQAPGSCVDPELEVWLRASPAQGWDLTVGGQAALDVAASNPLVGGFLQAQEHVWIDAGQRLVLQQEVRLFRIDYEDPVNARWHVKGTVAGLFVFDAAGARPFIGPKLGVFTGLTVTGSDWGPPGAYARDDSFVVFTGASAGLELGQDVPVVLGLDFGAITASKSLRSAPSLSLGIALGYAL